jgi:hypothetical protein
MDKVDYFENELRQLILMAADNRYDGYMREGLYNRLRKIRDLLDEEIKKYEG